MKVSYRKRAVADVQQLYDYFVGKGVRIADAFLAAVDAEVALLAVHPFLGRLRYFQGRAGVRSFRVRGFENILIFYYPGSSLEVIRVLHGARRTAAK